MWAVLVDTDCRADNPWTEVGCICATREIAEREAQAARGWFDRETVCAPPWFAHLNCDACAGARTRLVVHMNLFGGARVDRIVDWDVRVMEVPLLDV